MTNTPKKYCSAIPAVEDENKKSAPNLEKSLKAVELLNLQSPTKTIEDVPITSDTLVRDILTTINKLETLTPLTDNVILTIGKLRGAIIKLQG